MILRLDRLHSHYGKSHILQGVDLQIGNGELVTLLGRNGAGKSTTLKTIAGAVRATGGKIVFGGVELQGWTAWFVWLFVHLMYLAEALNRFVVFVRWGYQYLTFYRGARLITGDERTGSDPPER